MSDPVDEIVYFSLFREKKEVTIDFPCVPSTVVEVSDEFHDFSKMR